MKLNYALLNMACLNQTRLNTWGAGRGSQGSSSIPSGLIAQYKPYLNSNDSETRDILKDYSGHGNDIVLKNFAFAGMSGYGGYSVNLETISSNSNKDIVTKTETTLHCEASANYTDSTLILFQKINNWGNNEWIIRTGKYGLTIYVTGASGSEPERIYTLGPDQTARLGGLQSYIDAGKGYVMYGVNLPISKGEAFTFEQLPLYQGCLVSDGVDDYGVCETFPILTKEKGYTVCAIRTWIDTDDYRGGFVSNAKEWQTGALTFEFKYDSYRTKSFLGETEVVYPELFSYQTSRSYNGTEIATGSLEEGTPYLYLFTQNGTNNPASIALAALEIYDRDLSDEEIQSCKDRMMEEYEKVTSK